MRNENMDKLYPPTPDSFHDAMLKTVNGLREERFSDVRHRTVLLAAALLLALAGAAYATAAHFGVLSQLRNIGFEPAPGAETLVTTIEDAPTAAAGGVEFALTESAYDGEQIFLSIKMRSDSSPVVPTWAWIEQETPGTVYASLMGVFIGGEEVHSFEYGDAAKLDDEYFGMIIVPYKGAPSPEITLNLGTYCADTDARDECTITAFVPTDAALQKTLILPEPIEMNGVTVTALEMRYSKLKLYVTLKYTIDPNLPRFEMLRRQSMFFELTAPGRSIESRGGRSGFSDAEQVYIVESEYVATDEAFSALNVMLRGQDGEVYWQQTVNFKEDAK